MIGDVTANRFISNGSQLTNIKSLAAYVQADSQFELSDTKVVVKIERALRRLQNLIPEG